MNNSSGTHNVRGPKCTREKKKTLTFKRKEEEEETHQVRLDHACKAKLARKY